MTLETTLLPFLFPQGEGAHDGKISLHTYFKYHMTMWFSPFTLYKPYLLFMYDICQSIQLLQILQKHIVRKVLKKIQQWHN